jgi:hypothetical protein
MKGSKKPQVAATVRRIMKRYERYTRYLNYPGEWGERAFRGWVVYEVFSTLLGWPLENIVFGERYDVLFVDNEVKPVVYLETKKPGRGLADCEEFKARIPLYQTIKHAALANGYEWLRIDIATRTEETIKLDDSDSKWKKFVKHLLAKNYLYGE